MPGAVHRGPQRRNISAGRGGGVDMGGQDRLDLVPRIGPMLGVMPDDTRDVDISDLRPLLPGVTE